MKLLKHIFSSFILIQLIFSCSTNTEEKIPFPDASACPIIEPVFIDSLVGNGGVIRGINFGMSIEEIRGIETARHDETSLDTNGVQMVRFVEEFTMTKSMDVEYYFSAKNKLNEIVLIVYCGDTVEQNQVYIGLEKRIDQKNNLMFNIQQVGDEHNFNVELVISK